MIFPTFYTASTERINLLYTQVLDERFKRDITLTILNGIDVYKSRLEEIVFIEKRRTLQKGIKKRLKKKESDDHSNIPTYKQYKTKKDLESVLINKSRKPINKKSERDDTPVVSEEEDHKDTEEVIRELQENRLKNIFRNTDDDSETEESEARVILVIHPPAAPLPTSSRARHLRYYSNPVPHQIPHAAFPTCPTYETYSHGFRILHDDED
jgi:hypothetical protein